MGWKGSLNIWFCSDSYNSIGEYFVKITNKSVNESGKSCERWEWSNETLGEVLSNGENFAQG